MNQGRVVVDGERLDARVRRYHEMVRSSASCRIVLINLMFLLCVSQLIIVQIRTLEHPPSSTPADIRRSVLGATPAHLHILLLDVHVLSSTMGSHDTISYLDPIRQGARYRREAEEVAPAWPTMEILCRYVLAPDLPR